ncbi:MAG TPA: hypothetical protein VEO00_02060, partial [Actinomycetota bacterium]|nr:hypothetical protein [Actinomycetota bacterium]
EPAGLLLLPANGERLDGAVVPDHTAAALLATLAEGPFPAVAVPDLGVWGHLAGGGRSGRMLERLAGAVAPGGWLYAGFANPWYPARFRLTRAMRLRRAVRILHRAGMGGTEVYLAFPDQTCPAYLVSKGGPAELDAFLRHLFLPYAGASQGWRGRVKQRVLSLMRAAALVSPHSLKARFAPALAIVARRGGPGGQQPRGAERSG